jgi:hypothetical protein
VRFNTITPLALAGLAGEYGDGDLVRVVRAGDQLEFVRVPVKGDGGLVEPVSAGRYS